MTIQLSINGETRQCAPGMALSSLIEEMEVNPANVAVERNGAIVPRSEYARTCLEQGDALEIVHFIGGG